MPTRRDFFRQTAVAGLAAASTPFACARLSDTPPLAAPKRRVPGRVQTVQGVVEASRLGVTLPHEHICVSSPGFWQAWPEYFGGRANFVTTVAGKLKAAKDEGVDTIVDVTPFDVGRDVRLLQELSEKSGMQIITCTGHWLAPSLSMEARTVEELTDFFVLEIERGIDGTEIKPGVIKVATDAGLRAPHPLYHEGVTRFLEMALRAAARASIATGVPVTTHTTTVDRTGEKQAEIFESEGLNPAMVCLGHCDDTDDMAYLEGLVKRGYTIGMDHMTWGMDGAAGPGPAALSWQRRAQSVKRLLDDGFGNKIFLSNDWYFGISMAPTGFMKTKEQTNPDGILFSHRKVLPYLKQIGVSDQQIRMITVQNPRRFFGGLSI